MATITRRRIGPADHGRRMTLDEFIEADFEEGWLYELARGVDRRDRSTRHHHGRIVDRIARVFILTKMHHPGVINYRAGGGECRLRLPGMESDRHPDQADLSRPRPRRAPNSGRAGSRTSSSRSSAEGGEERDYVEKREEYLRIGVRNTGSSTRPRRVMRVLQRAGDVWEEVVVAAGAIYRTRLLPGLEVRPEELLGPAEGVNVTRGT